jgi:hypothetical protein
MALSRVMKSVETASQAVQPDSGNGANADDAAKWQGELPRALSGLWRSVVPPDVLPVLAAVTSTAEHMTSDTWPAALTVGM